MNSRLLLVIALCGLLMAAQRGVDSAPRQLLPLPSMAQQANNQAAISQEGINGELHVVQPTITLTASKEVVDAVDRNAPPLQSNIPLEVEIVKKEGPPGVAEFETVNGSDKTLVQTKEGPRTIKTIGYETISGNGSTTVVPLVTTAKPKGNGAHRISTSLFSTIVTSMATALLLGLARKHATLN